MTLRDLLTSLRSKRKDPTEELAVELDSILKVISRPPQIEFKAHLVSKEGVQLSEQDLDEAFKLLLGAKQNLDSVRSEFDHLRQVSWECVTWLRTEAADAETKVQTLNARVSNLEDETSRLRKELSQALERAEAAEWYAEEALSWLRTFQDRASEIELSVLDGRVSSVN